LHAVNFSAVDGALFGALGFARMVTANKFPLACIFAVLPDWFSTARHFCSVAAMRYHFLNKLGAWVAAFVALALAEVAASQRFLAVFTTSDFLWIFVAAHLERVSAASFLINLKRVQEQKKV